MAVMAVVFTSPGTARAEGYWKLVDIQADMTPRKDGQRHATPSVGRGEYVVTGKYYERGTMMLLDQWVVGMSWTPMPRVLRSGRKLFMTVRMRSVRRPKVFIGVGGPIAGGRLQTMQVDGNWPNFLVGVAVNPNVEDLRHEVERRERKVDNGAHFAMTQVFFDWEPFERLMDQFGGRLPIPVLVAVWPTATPMRRRP